ncbi:hypothetical protein EDB81DRAFT_768942 [Dactylonectria macrodidyma]|uniref:Xylanolytic transcriptional activator regulatory domain-containing protein n=1 Tax=Dactylonectria macrodidyma TaxID=307937 RepID=A0A9P9I734_9HYPO|nr:hypothetical protein EDB81DRAFT_768942 [Dactylonectria macrodidyma]
MPALGSNASRSALCFASLGACHGPRQQDSETLTSKFLPGSLAVQMSELERADLQNLFFERVHVFAPIINQRRYYALANQASEASESFPYLQHALWTLAASMGTYLLEEAVPIEEVQAWLLLSIYEILKTSPLRGWISASRCFCLVHILKLHEIDKPEGWHTSAWANLSWVEIEERRRTFCTAYALECYASLVNRQPLALNEQTILTRLPGPETEFHHQQDVETEFLALAIAQKSEQLLTPYAKTIVIVTVLARSISHRNQCHAEQIIEPKSQNYLARHTALDDILRKEILATLSSVSVDLESYDPTSFFTDVLAQATVLVLFMELNSVSQDTETWKDVYEIYEKNAANAAGRIHELTQSDQSQHNIPMLSGPA